MFCFCLLRNMRLPTDQDAKHIFRTKKKKSKTRKTKQRPKMNANMKTTSKTAAEWVTRFLTTNLMQEYCFFFRFGLFFFFGFSFLKIYFSLAFARQLFVDSNILLGYFSDGIFRRLHVPSATMCVFLHHSNFFRRFYFLPCSLFDSFTWNVIHQSMACIYVSIVETFSFLFSSSF